jgi:hypothetical protein
MRADSKWGAAFAVPARLGRSTTSVRARPSPTAATAPPLPTPPCFRPSDDLGNKIVVFGLSIRLSSFVGDVSNCALGPTVAHTRAVHVRGRWYDGAERIGADGRCRRVGRLDASHRVTTLAVRRQIDDICWQRRRRRQTALISCSEAE